MLTAMDDVNKDIKESYKPEDLPDLLYKCMSIGESIEMILNHVPPLNSKEVKKNTSTAAHTSNKKKALHNGVKKVTNQKESSVTVPNQKEGSSAKLTPKSSYYDPGLEMVKKELEKLSLTKKSKKKLPN